MNRPQIQNVFTAVLVTLILQAAAVDSRAAPLIDPATGAVIPGTGPSTAPPPVISTPPSGAGIPGAGPSPAPPPSISIPPSGPVFQPPSAAQGVLTKANVQPAQRQLIATQSNSFGVVWQVAATSGYSSGTYSRDAQIINPTTGAVLATVGGTLSRSGRAPYMFSELIDLPAASVQSWVSSGVRRLLLVRTFNSSGTTPATVRAQMVLNIASSALRAPRENNEGELLVQRLNLSFVDNQRVKVVQPADEVKAKVQISYSGNGQLQGRWQVAEPASTQGAPVYRTLTLVSQYLGAAQQTVLTSPLLPSNAAGKYLVRFCVTNREMVAADQLVLDAGCPSEALTVETVYQVLGSAESEALIDASPQSGTVTAASPFQWRAVPEAVVYQLQVFASSAAPGSQGDSLDQAPNFIAGMLLPAGVTETTWSSWLLSKLEPGQHYLWRVTAHDQNGSLIGRSREWRVRYQP